MLNLKNLTWNNARNEQVAEKIVRMKKECKIGKFERTNKTIVKFKKLLEKTVRNKKISSKTVKLRKMAETSLNLRALRKKTLTFKNCWECLQNQPNYSKIR